MSRCFVGCAGWGIPRALAWRFPGTGSHLERYARVLAAVEIDTSFYRSHAPRTYARWAASVPPGFRFAVKAPREATHVRRLAGATDVLARFIGEARALGDRLGPVLVQLPPGLPFDEGVARRFFATLRDLHGGPVACEPRHPSWFRPEAEALLAALAVARVGADPARVPAATGPGGWPGLAYYRLHGSPVVYRSAYPDAFLDGLAAAVRRRAATGEVWCIFDNTASGAAPANALALVERLAG